MADQVAQVPVIKLKKKGGSREVIVNLGDWERNQNGRYDKFEPVGNSFVPLAEKNTEIIVSERTKKLMKKPKPRT